VIESDSQNAMATSTASSARMSILRSHLVSNAFECAAILIKAAEFLHDAIPPVPGSTSRVTLVGLDDRIVRSFDITPHDDAIGQPGSFLLIPPSDAKLLQPLRAAAATTGLPRHIILELQLGPDEQPTSFDVKIFARRDKTDRIIGSTTVMIDLRKSTDFPTSKAKVLQRHIAELEELCAALTTSKLTVERDLKQHTEFFALMSQ
jgi:hypothetical protein